LDNIDSALSPNALVRHRMTVTAAAAIATLALMAAQAQAQTAAPAAPAADNEFKPVVITARKRSETLTQTPAAVSVFGTEEIADRNINTLSDIGKYVPNLDINRFGVGNPAHAAIFIRGIGLQDHIITTDPGVGVYLDGVYLGRQMGANLRLANIERVEVLRGPQGTLYGKNTLGGAINVITVQPGDEEINKVDLKLGTRGRVETGGYTNFKVSDQLSVAATLDATHRNGIGKALLVDASKDVGEENEYSGRVAAKLKVTNDFSLLLSIDGVRGNNGKSPSTIEINDQAAFFPANLGLKASQLPANPDDSNSGQAGLFVQTNKGLGTSLAANWRIDDHLNAKVLTGYRYSSYTGGLDDDHTFADLESFPERGYARQVSIEPQLNGEYGKLDFVTGLYYGREEGNTNSGPWVYIGPGGYFDIAQTTRSAAAYGRQAGGRPEAGRRPALFTRQQGGERPVRQLERSEPGLPLQLVERHHRRHLAQLRHPQDAEHLRDGVHRLPERRLSGAAVRRARHLRGLRPDPRHELRDRHQGRLLREPAAGQRRALLHAVQKPAAAGVRTQRLGLHYPDRKRWQGRLERRRGRRHAQARESLQPAVGDRLHPFAGDLGAGHRGQHPRRLHATAHADLDGRGLAQVPHGARQRQHRRCPHRLLLPRQDVRAGGEQCQQ
jgi:hypothetical protein